MMYDDFGDPVEDFDGADGTMDAEARASIDASPDAVRAALSRLGGNAEDDQADATDLENSAPDPLDEAWMGFVERHPEMEVEQNRAGLVELLRERPDLTSGAKTAAEIGRAWDTALELSSANEAHHATWTQAADLAVEHAVSKYANDDAELDDIVIALVAHVAPEDPRFGQFLESLHPDDAEQVVDWLHEYDFNLTAEQGQLEKLARVEQQMEQAAAEQELVDAQEVAFKEVRASTPGFDSLAPMLPGLLAATGEIQSPEGIKPALELAVRAARDVQRAAHVDHFKNEFLRSALHLPRPGDINFEESDDAARLPGRDPTPFDMEGVIAAPRPSWQRKGEWKAAFEASLRSPAAGFRAEWDAAAIRAEEAANREVAQRNPRGGGFKR